LRPYSFVRIRYLLVRVLVRSEFGENVADNCQT